jgi:hypothetical protein
VVNMVTIRRVLQNAGSFLTLQVRLCSMKFVITQQPATGRYLMPDKSTPDPHIPFY